MCIRKFCTKYNINNSETNPSCRPLYNNNLQKWQKPPENWWKLNFDAAFDKDTKICGIGLILRDCARCFVEDLVKVTRARDAEKGEGLYLLEAVELIKCRGWRNVIIEGDCESVTESATSNFAISSWQDHNLFSDISRLIESISRIRCVYFPRTGNEVADGLAKYAKKYVCNQVWSLAPQTVSTQL
ncbi:uncharacterized protein LOC113311870 [Papaver somniferum]|uniref:uncharacterized protein LOC113311870 n=1 Tax=Papaver somniferum TaxID=3469 RepID=UPI000E6F852F|nr:uncharacterized protein LOC113311870 [Papaver somniferum]